MAGAFAVLNDDLENLPVDKEAASFHYFDPVMVFSRWPSIIESSLFSNQLHESPVKSKSSSGTHESCRSNPPVYHLHVLPGAVAPSFISPNSLCS